MIEISEQEEASGVVDEKDKGEDEAEEDDEEAGGEDARNREPIGGESGTGVCTLLGQVRGCELRR
jgi:hypothetical protein